MLVSEGHEWTDGEEQAWHRLAISAPAEVCRRAGARFDEGSGTYVLNVFSASVAVHPGHREIRGTGNLCDLLLGKFPHYSRPSILWYLVQAQDIPPSGSLINPRELGGGLIFIQGSHMLPLDKLALRYNGDTGRFLEKGATLGGEHREFGDAAIMLYPFPRIPVLLVLWQKDEEFPAGAQLLLDATCSRQLTTDIVWSTAML